MVDEATAKTIATQEINRTYEGEFGPLVILGEHTIEKTERHSLRCGSGQHGGLL